mgnify:CR=1 FL=1
MYKKYFLGTLVAIFLVWMVPAIVLSIANPELEWDWENIDTKNIHFSKKFVWGTATAAHQVEGNNTNNNWYQWELDLDNNGIITYFTSIIKLYF